MKHVLFTLVLTSALLMPMHGKSQGSTVTLQSLRNHSRVLLVFDNGDNRLAEQQLIVAADHIDGFKARDLLLAGISGSNAAVPAAKLSATDDAAERKRFHVRPDQFTVILIGKDGGEKLRSHQPISWQKLQSTIDAMPMRQTEMRPGEKQ